MLSVLTVKSLLKIHFLLLDMWNLVDVRPSKTQRQGEDQAEVVSQTQTQLSSYRTWSWRNSYPPLIVHSHSKDLHI